MSDSYERTIHFTAGVLFSAIAAGFYFWSISLALILIGLAIAMMPPIEMLFRWIESNIRSY